MWLVKGKAVEDSQDARQEVLLPAYRVTGKPGVVEGIAASGLPTMGKWDGCSGTRALDL